MNLPKFPNFPQMSVPKSMRLIVYDGRFEVDEDAAIEYIGYNKKIADVLKTTTHWKGHDAVLVDISDKNDYKIVHRYIED